MWQNISLLNIPQSAGRAYWPRRAVVASLVTVLLLAEGTSTTAAQQTELPAPEPNTAADAAAEPDHSTELNLRQRRILSRQFFTQVKQGDHSAALDTADTLARSLPEGDRQSSLAGAVDRTRSRMGGAASADFGELIDLLTKVIEPESWEDVGGPGSVEQFELGVSVDAEGVLRRRLTRESAADRRLSQLRGQLGDAPASFSSVTYTAPAAADEPSDISPVGSPATDSTDALRMISLPALEWEARRYIEAGMPIPDTIRSLGGLGRIRYVFVFPDRKDLVIAGYPAWASDPSERDLLTAAPTDAGSRGSAERRLSLPRSDEVRRPFLQLDDLVLILRSLANDKEQSFGCSIEPRPEALKEVNDFRLAMAGTPLTPNTRGLWARKLREKLGHQDIRVWGVPASSRVAHIMIEADYRMKLIGIGLEKGPPGIPSYLNLLREHTRGAPPPLETLRWWLTPKYESIVASSDGLAFELRGQAVQCLSENQFLLANGQRVPTGQAEPLNRLFARNFTEHYDTLAQQEPTFAELRNIFDLAVVAALISKHGLAKKIGWDMEFFTDEAGYPVELGPEPQSVESMVNYQVLNRRHVVTAVGGGVVANVWKALDQSKRPRGPSRKLNSVVEQATAGSDGHWWWE